MVTFQYCIPFSFVFYFVDNQQCYSKGQAKHHCAHSKKETEKMLNKALDNTIQQTMFVSPPEKKPTKERKNIHKQVYLTPVSTLVKPTAKNM